MALAYKIFNFKAKHLYFLIILFIFLISFFIRFNNLGDHFTHVDDIGLAKLITEGRNIDLAKNVFDKSSITYNSNYKFFLREYFPETNNKLYQIMNFFYPYLIGSAKNTYAPINPIFINFFIPEKASYDELKFWGRFPSFLFSYMSIIIFFLVLLRTYHGSQYFYLLIPLALFSFSYQHIIMGSQMHNFALAPFCTIIFLYLITLKDFFKTNISFKFLLLITFLMSVSMYLHFQSILLLLTIFIYDFIKGLIKFRNKEIKFFLLIKYFFLKYIFTLIIILPILVWLQIKKFETVSWNKGPNNEFLFNQELFLSDFTYLFQFLLSNSQIVFSRMLSFTTEFKLENYNIDFIIFIFVLLGFYTGLKVKNKKLNILTLFSIIFFSVLICFVLTSNLALSPTRHSIIILPLIIILINNNFIYFYEIKNPLFIKKSILTLIFFLLILITFMFFYDYRIEMSKRTDQFNENKIHNLLKENNVTAIINYDWTTNTKLMPSLNELEHFLIDFIPLINDEKNDGSINLYNNNKLNLKNHKTVALISSVSPLPINSNNIKIIQQKYPLSSYTEYFSELRYFIENKFEFWQLNYMYENIVNKEVDFSSLTNNTSNNIFIYIYKIN